MNVLRIVVLIYCKYVNIFFSFKMNILYVVKRIWKKNSYLNELIHVTFYFSYFVYTFHVYMSRIMLSMVSDVDFCICSYLHMALLD